MTGEAPAPPDYVVELPAGGDLTLQSPVEVQLWQDSLAKFREEYTLAKQNDLVALGQLLQQQIIMYRCMLKVNQTDGEGNPIEIDAGELALYQQTMTSASKEMRAIELSLGIDKKTRESGGTHTVDSYVTMLKRAAHARGVHIVERTKQYEQVMAELRWRIRVLKNGDKEDRAYHGITAKSVIEFAEKESLRLEDMDKKFNKDKGRLWAGKL